MFITQHTLHTSTDREGSGYMQLLLLSMSRYIVFGKCNINQKWFPIISELHINIEQQQKCSQRLINHRFHDT